jgi:Sec-independent protein secretion pathway component TatC
MAVPMYLLYEFGILMSRLMLRAKVRRETELQAEEKKADA